MSSICKACGVSCSRDKISCGVCHNNFHTKCAIQENPNLTAEIAKLFKKGDCGIVYKCKTCTLAPLPPQESNNADSSSKLGELENSIKELTKIISEEVMSQLSSIKSELEKCLSKTKSTEEFVHSKIHNLEIENNSLKRQLYRSDILVNGLPSDLKREKLYDVAFKIGQILNVDIQHNDINICSYIKQKKEVLIKFNSVFKRDMVVKNYFESRSLKLSQLITNDSQNSAEANGETVTERSQPIAASENRVYINDHLPPIAAKLNFICRKMRKENKIKKFKLFNRDVPEVKITTLDDKEKSFSPNQLYEFLKSVSAQNVHQNNAQNNTEILSN